MEELNALNWQIFLTLGVIIAFIMTVVKPIVTLNTTLVELKQAIEAIQKQLRENERDHDKNWEEHGEFRARIEALEDR
jgi:uncharacterized membrane protein (DUF106 family)